MMVFGRGRLIDGGGTADVAVAGMLRRRFLGSLVGVGWTLRRSLPSSSGPMRAGIDHGEKGGIPQ